MEPTIEFRRGTPDDSRACHRLLYTSVNDFERDHGTPLEGTEDDWWASEKPFYGLLATEHAEWWVAEERETKELIGFARSIENDGLFELTEFFVRTGNQGRGLGRELLGRAFPLGRGTVRTIIATRDGRALTRYYAAGVVARFPILALSGATNPADMPAGLTARRVAGDPDIASVRVLEHSLLQFERSEAALQCLLDNREAYLYRRDGTDIGFAFLSEGGSGPIGALDPADTADILLHVENRAHEIGMERMSLEVPAPNEVAVRHLLSRGFRFDPFISFLMSDRPFGQFDRIIGLSPPLFL